jgi:hypothetical protein
MMRWISILLVIAGLLAAGLGGAALMDQHFPREEAPGYGYAASSPEEAPAQMAAAGPAPPEPAAPSAIVQAEEPMPAPAPEAIAEPDVQAEAAPPSEEEFNFQPMMEEATPEAAPIIGSIPPGPPETEDLAAADAPPEAVDIDDPGVTAAVSASFIDKLRTVPVAHETPPSAEYKRAFDVTFAIDATGDTTAVDALPGRGVVKEGEARVSDRVEVRLSGAAFTINPTSPPVQSLSPLTENTWRWSVTALSAGDHDLTFEIFAIDENEVVPLRTFRDTVTVRVSGLNRAIAFADQANPLFVLLGGLGSILAGVLGVARFVLKK